MRVVPWVLSLSLLLLLGYRYAVCATVNINGTRVPKYFISSQHQGYALDDAAFHRYNNKLMQTTKDFYAFAESHHMLCSAHAGTHIAVYRDGRIIPWDDDYDLICREKDWHVLLALWSKPSNMHVSMADLTASSWGPRWKAKIVSFSPGKHVYMLKYKDPRSHWFKFRPITLDKVLHNEGGVDVIYMSQQGLQSALWLPACGPLNHDTTHTHPWYDLDRIKVRAPLQDSSHGESCLDVFYGPKWRIARHPRQITPLCGY